MGLLFLLLLLLLLLLLSLLFLSLSLLLFACGVGPLKHVLPRATRSLNSFGFGTGRFHNLYPVLIPAAGLLLSTCSMCARIGWTRDLKIPWCFGRRWCGL